MNIEINMVEVASELAHDAMINEMFRDEIIITEEEVFIEDDETTKYTDTAQEIFNKHYNYFYDKLFNLKLRFIYEQSWDTDY